MKPSEIAITEQHAPIQLSDRGVVDALHAVSRAVVTPPAVVMKRRKSFGFCFGI